LGRLRVPSGAEVIRFLADHAFVEVRRRGSHRVLPRTTTANITVAVPDHREVRLGTLASIIRQSELTRSLFEDF
jgi:predicted RNA binding protein YcfA (HicA-like mRNA interferase family)